MANRKNITTEKAKSKTAKPLSSNISTATHANMSWLDITLIVPLGIILISCLVQLPSQLNVLAGIIFSPGFGAILITSPLPFLLVTVFCCLALYLLLAKRSIGRFATTSTLIFATVALCFIIGTILGAGRTCGELDCSTASALHFYALFLYNPLANLLWNILSITGIVLLVRRLK